ncbi:Lsr2 family protein [Mycobacterium sp. MYCO198283]|uniref:histone-like nucleoid-structuring protein Lsr2 n=1 Tax=Mycobacterium sp. MYCO198283 TaxID=2883505 RepID=UPI001E2F511D|nr:Lsr2 family protein [Mycobacterium sp. MYCO198283]MCG5434018.1 Lsr2 family protein [Mycobacterium sp. MYCO198283]
MAKKTVVMRIDDTDGWSEAAETVSVSLDGVDYEIDLSTANAKHLRDELRPWIRAARRTGGRRQSSRPARAQRAVNADVREWARRNGYEVGVRGRLPDDVVDAYTASTKGQRSVRSATTP